MFYFESVSVVIIVRLGNTDWMFSFSFILTSQARLFKFPHSSKALVNKMWSYHPSVERRGVNGTGSWWSRVGNNTRGARNRCARWGRRISNDHSYLTNIYLEFESAGGDGKKEKWAAQKSIMWCWDWSCQRRNKLISTTRSTGPKRGELMPSLSSQCRYTFLLFLLVFARPGHSGLRHLERTNIADLPRVLYITPPCLGTFCSLHAENSSNSKEIHRIFLGQFTLFFWAYIAETRSSIPYWVCSVQ